MIKHHSNREETLDPILSDVNSYKVIKGRIKFYIFLFKITIAVGIAFYGLRTLLEKSLIGGCHYTVKQVYCPIKTVC